MDLRSASMLFKRLQLRFRYSLSEKWYRGLLKDREKARHVVEGIFELAAPRVEC